jgi:hypothetical protein
MRSLNVLVAVPAALTFRAIARASEAGDRAFVVHGRVVTDHGT